MRDYNLPPGKVTREQEKQKSTKHSKFLIFPDDCFRIIWDNIIVLCLIYISVALPIKVSFFETESNLFVVYDIVISIIFLFDIFVNFNRVFLDKNNHFVTSRKQIALRYLRCWFWVDLLATFPFSVFLQNLNSLNQALKYLKISKVFNLIHLVRVIKIFKRVFNSQSKRRLTRMYLKYKTSRELFYIQIMSNLIFIHILACLVYYIPTHLSPEANWVKARDLFQRTVFEKYLFSLHYVIETFITVGYGEVPVK